MNNITINNYEAFFLDFLEGNLNSEQLSELSLFLALHPELKPELKDYSDLQLQPESKSFKNKTQLKKFTLEETTVNNSNFDDFCIGYQEHILSDEKLQELIEFCQNKPRLKKDFDDYQKIVLKPDLRVNYKHKKSLYKKTTSTTLLYSH